MSTRSQYPYRPPRVDPTFRDYQTEVPPMIRRNKAQNGTRASRPPAHLLSFLLSLSLSLSLSPVCAFTP